MKPKGKLLIIGGAEDKGETDSSPAIKARNKEFKHYEILSELAPATKGKKRCIEVITTASEQPLEMSRVYRQSFEKAGFPYMGHIHVEKKEEAQDPDLIKRIENAHAVLFTGGNQFRLSTILGGSRLIEAIHERYMEDKNFIVAGTSAGAMVMSRLMIYHGTPHEALLKGEVKISSGFGLIDNCIIDTHFIKRGRFGRLAQAVVMNPTCTGIGLGEDTALVIKKGNIAICRGSGMVIVIDGKEIGHTNISYVEEDMPICVEHLKVHILVKGNGFLLRERKFIPAGENAAGENPAEKEADVAGPENVKTENRKK